MSFINDYLNQLKRESNRGRCLHYSDGIQCNEIIDAHSIQKRGQLAHIAERGHVYRLDASMATLRKSGGLPTFSKIGINKVSTFAGFCKRHDNSLFEPIDNGPLVFDRRQVALYAYRCLCREFFVKENAVRALKKIVQHAELDSRMRAFFQAARIGHSRAFRGLLHHKQMYDDALYLHQTGEFHFVRLDSENDGFMQVSGLLYPDYDFHGKPLQDLRTVGNPHELITFFTAPTELGWTFCFAWHESSNSICYEFVKSLIAHAKEKCNFGDVLLRFVISCCENHALKVSWWERLSVQAQEHLSGRAAIMMHPTIPVPPAYLTVGCEGITNVDFKYIYTSSPFLEV